MVWLVVLLKFHTLYSFFQFLIIERGEEHLCLKRYNSSAVWNPPGDHISRICELRDGKGGEYLRVIKNGHVHCQTYTARKKPSDKIRCQPGLFPIPWR